MRALLLLPLGELPLHDSGRPLVVLCLRERVLAERVPHPRHLLLKLALAPRARLLALALARRG